MPALRKMLGDIRSAECIALMRLIETQSKQTLATWTIAYSRTHFLPILQKYLPQDEVCASTLEVCAKHLHGTLPLARLKPQLKTCRETAASIAHPVAQAAARAISTACATVQTPTNALGYLFYGAAAVAYDALGVSASPADLNIQAQQELQHALDDLRAVAITNEPNPVNINWNC